MVLDRLETILNRNVADSRRGQALTRQLDGRVMSLVVEGTPVTIFLRADGGRVTLTPRHDGTVDATISGTPIALLALAGPRGEGALRGGGVRIEGDAEVAQRFRDLLSETRPDFEEELSHVVGDVAARRVANLARDLIEWGRRTSGSFASTVAEYLQEEGRDLPTRTEVEEFLAGVDLLRDDTERFEARVGRLEADASRPARGSP